MLGAERVQKVGPFVLGERLGVGGMAEVFVASGAAGETVALKRILPALARDREFCDMFWDEARVTSRLEHPNIVRVLDYGRFEASGRAAGELYMALEFVDGPSLSKLLRKAARERAIVDWAAVVQLGAELLAALDFVHHATDERGRALSIIHRDVSPGNILITSRGQVKLGDFGIVRSEIVARRTQPGELKGKIGYMSPEQASGGGLDPRSDLFSVGIVLAELLSLRPLFLGKNEMETLGRTVQVDLSTWHRYNGSVPIPLRVVVERALGRAPQDRFGSAREMRQAWLDAARAAKIQLDPGALGRWLVELGFVEGGATEKSGERLALAALESRELARVSPLGLPTLRRGKVIWSVPTSRHSLLPQLLLALRRVSTGGVEVSQEGRSLYLELHGGRIAAAHDSTGRDPLGRLLLEESILDKSDVTRAIGESRRAGLRLGEHLVIERKLRESVLLRLLGVQLSRRLASALEYDNARLSVLVHEGRSASVELEGTPESHAQVVGALRSCLTPAALDVYLAPVLDAVVLPALGATDLSGLGLTAPEARALATTLEGGALEGRSIRGVIETVVRERLAQRREVEFALFVGLAAGLIHAPGFSPA